MQDRQSKKIPQDPSTMTSQFPSFIHVNDARHRAEAIRRQATRQAVQQPSKLSIDLRGTQDCRNVSKNPYRQYQAASTDSLSKSSSQRDEFTSATVCKHTPSRAVFKDLSTAHSSITSGSARSGKGAVSNNLSDLNDERYSIPLQALEPARYNDGNNLLADLPRLPPPAVISQSRYSHIAEDYVAENDHEFNSQKRTRLEQPSEPAVPDMVGRKSLADHSSIYHSSLGDAPSGSLPLSSPDYGIVNNLRGHGRVNESCGNRNGRHREVQTPAAAPEQSFAVSGPLSESESTSNDASSLPEGSTVGNIYKHYISSDGFYNLDRRSDDAYNEEDLKRTMSTIKPCYAREASDHDLGRSPASLSNGQVKPSALSVRKQRRANRLTVSPLRPPPRFALHGIARHNLQHVDAKTSQGISHSSSSEDTQRLLEITQHWPVHKSALSRSQGRPDLRSDQNETEIGQTASTRLNPNTKLDVNNVPQVVFSQASVDKSLYDDDGYGSNYPTDYRQPLEREVSKALRRASGYSIYSNGSISSSVLQRYGDVQSDAPSSKCAGMLKQLNIGDTPSSELDIMDEKERDAAVRAQARAFYEQGAVAPNWITAHNVVRVPIQHNGSFPDSPPDSPPDQTDMAVGHRGQARPYELEEDVNDWETVGESAFGYGHQIPGMLGGTVRQTGSSIADNSDDGTASPPLREIDGYDSTDRIAQHPGHTQYFGVYRQRSLKKTNMPVFLPVFREHKINGYLADSTRIRPPPTHFNYNPPPLTKSHTNPFKSPPPDFAAVGGSKPNRDISRNRTLNPNFYSPSQITDRMGEQSVAICQVVSSISVTTPSTPVEQCPQTFNWMDDFGDPGPAVKTQSKPFLDIGNPNRPTSWQHVVTLANGGVVPGYNLDGSRIATRANNDSTVTKLRRKAQVGNSPEISCKGGKENLMNGRDHKRLVKGPPGAFYQDLRSRPDSKHSSWSCGLARPAKAPARHNSTKDLPTNTLRPLSLLTTSRPSTPIGHTDRNPSEDIRQNDFVYRSPLAPPKRESWQKLYSISQLNGIREAAKADGIFESQVQASSGLLGESSIKDGGSRKHLFESPRLFHFARDFSARTDLSPRKQEISIIVLCLCNFFPPMLFLYAIGQLDGIVVWWTNGEFTSFGRDHKKRAYFLLCCWVLCTFFGLVTFLVYSITHRHS